MKISFYESGNEDIEVDIVESNIIPEIGSGLYLDDLVFVKSVYINYNEDECMVFFIRAQA